MRYASLFTGIGGFDLGFDRAGMECVLQVEQDKHALNILNRHWPTVPKMEDVRDVTKETIEGSSVDLICGGFPCQDVSVAGKRKGLSGERSGLWHEFHRILHECHIPWVVIENVPGLLSSNGGRDMLTVVRGLEECRYRWAYRVLDLQYWGVPQRRRRVFIVGHLGDGAAAEVLFESEGMPWYPQASRGARTGDTGEPEECPPAIMQQNTRNEVREVGGKVTGALSAEAGMKQQNYVAYSTADRIKHQDSVASTLKADGGGTGAKSGLYATYRREEWDQRYPPCNDLVARTLDASYGDKYSSFQYDKGDKFILSRPLKSGGNSRHAEDHETYIPNSNAVRRLTPTECERLQGFPDGWTDDQPDTQRYKQLGNAVGVPVAKWIGERILSCQ